MRTGIKTAAAVVLTCFAQLGSAEQITIEHTFTSGSQAKASEVNANFSLLTAESNAQDSEIKLLGTENNNLKTELAELKQANVLLESKVQMLEDKSVQDSGDQLVCSLSSISSFMGFYGNGSAQAKCIQSSSPTAIRQLNYPQVVAEGWKVKLMDSSYLVFEKP